MATRNIKGTIQLRRDTIENWESRNPVLAAGELSYDTTNKQLKIGDGVTLWTDLPYLASKIQLFAEMSWADIAAVSASGKAREVFGTQFEYGVAKKIVELSTGEKITVTILGFDHDDLVGGGKAGLTIGMENCLATTYRMNSSNTNVGSWNSTEMRTSTMQTLLSRLPSDLQAVLKTVVKKQTAGNQSTNITTSEDKLFLFSEREVDNTTATGYAGEGEQYEYWRVIKDGTVAANRIKYLSNGSGSAVIWWLRSPDTSNATNFRTFNSSGFVYFVNASVTLGVSFGFCI